MTEMGGAGEMSCRFTSDILQHRNLSARVTRFLLSSNSLTR